MFGKRMNTKKTNGLVVLLAIIMIFVSVATMLFPTGIARADEIEGDGSYEQEAEIYQDGQGAESQPYEESQESGEEETTGPAQLPDPMIVDGGEEATEPVEEEVVEEETEPEAPEKKKLEYSYKSAETGKTFIITVAYDDEAGIPEGTVLSVKEINKKPAEPKDKNSQEYKSWLERPKDWERFVETKELQTMRDDLVDALGLKEILAKEAAEKAAAEKAAAEQQAAAQKAAEQSAEDAAAEGAGVEDTGIAEVQINTKTEITYTRFLEISLLADGKEVKPLTPVEVTIETEEVQIPAKPDPALNTATTEVAQELQVGVFDKEADKTKNEKVYKKLTAENISDKLENEEEKTPEERKTTRVRFATDELGQFGLLGVKTTKTVVQAETPTEGGADEPAPVEEDVPEEVTEMPATVFEAEIYRVGAVDTSKGVAVENASEVKTGSSGSLIKVTVIAEEGTFPQGTTMRVQEVTQNPAIRNALNNNADISATKYQAVDITFFDIDGNKIEPAKPVKVIFASDFIQKEKEENDTAPTIVHLLDSDNAEILTPVDTEIAEEKGAEDTVAVMADGFSVYVLIGSNGEIVTPQLTYTFWVPNGDIDDDYKEYAFKDDQDNTIYTQTITSGDELVVPQMTSTESEVFDNWYKGSMNGGTLVLDTEPYDFDNITITENGAVDLYAVYKTYVMVYYHDQYDNESEIFPVAYTRRAELVTTGEGESATTSATVKISDLKTTYTSTDGSEMAFLGWSYTMVPTPGVYEDPEHNPYVIVPDENGCITVTEDTHLYPIYKTTHLLSFYAAATGMGAAYNGPRYLFDGEYLEGLPITSMTGYTFTGWWTGTMGANDTVDYGKQISNPDGSLIAGADDAGVYVDDEKLYLRADTTLYARWEDNTTADYRIIYWTQNGQESDYLYKETITHNNATVGETVSVSDAEKANDRYPGYHLKEEPESAVVKADGSTVLYVYYDHNEGYNPSSGNYDLTFADSVTEEGKTSLDLPQTTSVEYGKSLKDYIISNPTSGRKGYKFSNWFLDPGCTTVADLDNMKMPDQELTLYAGWEVEWYVVSIDPNYGELRPLNDQGKPTGTGSTWFSQTVERNPIAEYNYVERNYVESSSGNYYYVYHPGDGTGGSEWPDRYTYYTTDPSKSTEDTTFEYAPGAFTYAGWYEVHEDGTEIPYVFGEPTDHNTTLKLHWKKNGNFSLAYDAGDGTLENNEKTVIQPEVYSDDAKVTLTRAANAPAGKTFVGWKVKDSDSNIIYKPGQVFNLHADDAKRVSGKDVVSLEAVYVVIGTASIIYNANGGTVAESGVDFGKLPGSDAESWVDASGTIDTAAGTATVSGLTNNTKVKLSDGTGFAKSGATFLGWSDKEVCDDSATFYDKNSTVIYGANTKEPKTLYAVWSVSVKYHLNNENADWGGEWPPIYEKEDLNTYSQKVNIGDTVSEPINVPVNTGNDGRTFLYWATRTGSGTEGNPYVYTEYDFSNAVKGELDLYAYWDQIHIRVRAVDSSSETLADKTSAEGWTVTDITVTTAEQTLTSTSNVTTPANYEFAFAAVANDLDSVSESNAVTKIKYDAAEKKVKVFYQGESEYRVLDDDKEIYFVYYLKKTRNIGYKSMDESGVLSTVTTTGAPATTGDTLLGTYDMSSNISDPLSFVDTSSTGIKFYAFAIGEPDPGSGTDMNASNLSLITDAVGAGDPVPTLRVRNTWRGFQYTTQTGDDAKWISCGYDIQLYVIYYTEMPTIVMFHEKTVGISADMNTGFVFNLLVTQTTTTTTSVQTQKKNDQGEWEDYGDPSVTTDTTGPVTIYDTTAEGNQPYTLKNGEANSAILFYNSSKQTGEPVVVDEDTRTITTTSTVSAQTAVITQTENVEFNTKVKEDEGEETETRTYTHTADGSGGTKNAIFTNTRKSLSVEVHVAMVETGGIIQRDKEWRSAAEKNYKFDLPFGSSETLLTKLPSNNIFTGDKNVYAFGTALDGSDPGGEDPNPLVTVENMGVVSVSYEQIEDNICDLVLKDGDGKTMGVLGSNKIYYLYYPMAKIRYVKEASDGTLENITGCLADPVTGVIEPSNSVTYSHDTISMNGKTVEQNQNLEIPLTGLIISQNGNHFRMPPTLDDGLFERYLSYDKLGAGNNNAERIGDLETTSSLTMLLRIQNNSLQYSFDGSTWKDLSLSGIPTVYAVYTERGYDLQISKTVDTSQSGVNPIFTDSSFTVTIESMSITKDSYSADGADSDTIPATRASGDVPGRITLTVADGTIIRIKGLGRGDYTIKESGNENFTLSAKIGPIIGGTATSADIIDNTIIKEKSESENIVKLNTEKKIDITNSPKAICRIGENYFYTLQSMIDYVEENIATKRATAEMLTDYLMPAADTLIVPEGFDITLTTIGGAERAAVITRTEALTAIPMITNNGKLTLESLTLEGNNISTTVPVIQSAGDLTIGDGAIIQHANNNSSGEKAVYGGAISATAGNITVSGSIINCSSAEGGAIYHSGIGTITVNYEGKIINNMATTGNGGAIHLAGGTIKVSGTSEIESNSASYGKGGAIYADNAVIEVDQGGCITNNTAKEGGAIYVENVGTITISKTEGAQVEPSINSNTASAGNGGAIYVKAGSVTVSGGEVSNNNATNGNGGAIFGNTASVTISGTAEVKTNTAKEGGAIYAASGAVTVSGGVFGDPENNKGNTAEINGGAIYAGSGNVTISDGAIQNNTASTGSGGAVYAGSGNVAVTGGSLTSNTAKADGGAIYADQGTVTLSVLEGGTAPAISSNTATDGNGGAIYSNTGAVSITGITLTGNSAGTNGGAVYNNTGAVSVTNCVFGGAESSNKNTAGTSGGAIYAGSGNVTVVGGSMIGNTATSGNGGAVYGGSGVITVSENATFSNNNATSGNGGALYTDSGSATLTSATVSSNSAINGSAVFVNTGRATLNNGGYTGNIASNGGAIGVGDVTARLYFNGNVRVTENTLGTGESAPKSNVYLDQDDDAVINIDTLGSDASIGIYVPDAVVNTRSVPGARFAVYSSTNNVSKITNDRFPALNVQSDTAAKKLYWGNFIKVTVSKLTSYGGDFVQPKDSAAGTVLGKYDVYYPEFSDAAISELASEIVTKYSLNIGTSVYAGAYLDPTDDVTGDYDQYLTRLTWDTTNSKWTVTKRDGTQKDLQKTDQTIHRIYIYYAEPAYISIENNTAEKLDISNMTVGGYSVINSETVAGYGMVFAKNGAIRSALLPVTAEDLKLDAGTSINLLIPGGKNKTYTLNGNFETTKEYDYGIRLRRGEEEHLSEKTIIVSGSSGDFDPISGTTLNSSGTYQIIFGDDKVICKVVDASGEEHPYSKISDAIAEIKNGVITLAAAKTATIEMVTDYLLPASDKVEIPQGYDITLTTASKTGGTYNYNGEGNRAIISRDSENKASMINSWNAKEGNQVVTTLQIRDLIFDGKSVRGNSDGGAVASQFTNVYIENTDFKNVYASNGGALLVMFEFNKSSTKDAKDILPGSELEVKTSNFTGCTSTTTQTSNRLGGGAIVTNAETMTLENCTFNTCTAVDQAGAVFHRVDKNNNSWTNITGCTFTNCSANAAGGLELDSKTINVKGCTFEHCVANQRNGGGFNVYALNAATPTADCWVTVSGCTFNDCQLTTTNISNGNGGGFRSNAVYTKVENSTFTNNLAIYGGGFCISNGNAKSGEIYGCTFERCTANGNGGGVYGKPAAFIIDDCKYIRTATPIENLDSADAAYFSKSETVNGTTYYTYAFVTDSNGAADAKANAFKTKYELSDEIKTRQTEIKNCTSKNHGGGLYHDKNAASTSLTIKDSVITGNRMTANSMNGGGVYTNCRKVIIDGSTITDNACTNQGGGVYANASTSMTIEDSNISRNTSAGNGGGIYFVYSNQNISLTLKGSNIDDNNSNGNGGGIYTEAGTVTIEESKTKTDESGNKIRSSVSNNTAKAGGGIYQARNVDGSKLEISKTNVIGNTANNGAGGGIYASVRQLTTTTSEISRNSATGDGGGIWFDVGKDTDRVLMSLKAEGCALDTNTSGGNGGGIYTLAKKIDITAHTEGTGEGAVTTRTTISNSIAAKNGGGVYQNRDVEGSVLTIFGTDIRNNTANGTGNQELGGGGVYANVRTMTLTNSEVTGNTAIKHGGGICKNSTLGDSTLIVDNSRIKNNTASSQGGGIYDRSHLWLRNNAEITGNRLTTNTAGDCAGVYLNNERTLYVGPENSISSTTDTIIVRDNTTANGTLSDLRLWDNNGTENNSQSVYVYCNLSENSEIRVVNANKVDTQFGSSKFADPDGFSDNLPVFKADASTLHGIIDRNDENKKKIIWAGPPIAKITDGIGNLLYLKGGEKGTFPAIFDKLGIGGNQPEYSSVAAFNMLCTDEPPLFNADGSQYTGNEYCIKMLGNYETPQHLFVSNVADRTITFTTAGTDKDKEDGYPFLGSGTRATVTRGSTVNVEKSTLNAYGSLILENIVIDGGSESGVTPGKSTRCLWVETTGSRAVTLGENALLQNGSVSSSSRGGGGVYIQSGSFKIEGGVIRNCEANNGGGIFEKNGTLTLSAGSIYQCTSTGNGGGVYQESGSFYMSGGVISNGSASASGGGVYVANYKTFNMTGGSIINNSAGSTGGGIAIGGDQNTKESKAKLYFSGKVNVSGNTATKDNETVPCNVELSWNSKDIINTNNGGLYSGSYIGVYVPGDRDDDNPDNETDPYKTRGGEKDAFGSFETGDNTTTFYSFVNDRNGLKGGIIENPDPNTIYWIQIFSLSVSKNVVSGASTTPDPDEPFLFKVNIRGKASVSGQLDAKDIDSRTGDYGEMYFISNGVDTTTAVFALKAQEGENTVTGVNLSEGLSYEVIEYLIVSDDSYSDQQKRYAAMPMNGYSTATETLKVGDVEYTVMKANTYSSKIGENKGRKDETGVDPYTSAIEFTNLMPVCKITDKDGNLLYKKYYWNKITNKDGEGKDGPNVAIDKRPFYYAPAVYTELKGVNDGAFEALDGLYTYKNKQWTSYSADNGVRIEMLIGEYSLREAVEVETDKKVKLTTALSTDTLFPKQDSGTTSVIKRTFANSSMFTASGDLTLDTIALDGNKSAYTVEANGGLVNVPSNGKLTIQNGAILQNSRTAASDGDDNPVYGGAVYVASKGVVNMTGGSIIKNESLGDGAGIYLTQESTLNLSGNPNFGGKGTSPSGDIYPANSNNANGNFKTEELIAQYNGGKPYRNARQDIFIAGVDGPDDDTSAASLHITGKITSAEESIWVWAEGKPHYKALHQFAKVDGTTDSNSLKAFRNARPDSDTDATDKAGNIALYGIMKSGDDVNVYWYGIEGSRKVILRKVDSETYQSLQGAEFTIYASLTSSPVMTGLVSDSSGTFFVGELNYGTYYVQETKAPAGHDVPSDGSYFIITVDKDGVGYRDPDTDENTKEVVATKPE